MEVCSQLPEAGGLRVQPQPLEVRGSGEEALASDNFSTKIMHF